MPNTGGGNVREAVQFAPAIDKLASAGYEIYLEIAAHPVLSSSVKECLTAVGSKLVLPSLRRMIPERATMLTSLGSLYLLGVKPDWSRVIPGPHDRVTLPTYRWNKRLFWHEPPIARENRVAPSTHPLLLFRVRHPERSWHGQLDRKSHPWLNDHRVQGHMVFPGAGYIEMALSSGMEATESRIIQVEDIEFIKPLFIPASGDIPTIQITHSASGPDFRIFSRRGDIKNEWSVHSSGRVRSLHKKAPTVRGDIQAIRERCTQSSSGQAFYDYMTSCGLIYGPYFQAVQHVWFQEGEALAEIVLPKKLEKENIHYAFHPSLMDACFQITTNTHFNKEKGTEIFLRLPVFVDRIRYFKSPGTHFWCHTRLVRQSATGAVYDCEVYNQLGEVLVEFRGMKAQVVHGNRASAHGPTDKLLYEQEWQSAPLITHKRQSQPGLFFPDRDELEAKLRRTAVKEATELGLQSRMVELQPKIDALCAAIFDNALHELNPGIVSLAAFTSHEVQTEAGIAAGMVPVFQRLLARRIDHEKQAQADLRPIRPVEVEALWREIANAVPSLTPELILLDRCGNALAKVLRGEIDAAQVLTRSGSNQLEHFFAKSLRFRVPHTVVHQAIAEVVAKTPEGRKLRVLELGAGTGGLSSEVLPALQEGLAEYYFTDVSSDSFHRAEQKLRDYPFVRYEVLSIEQEPDQAQWPTQSFDIILAGHVLQAVELPHRSLGFIQRLLRPGGMLIVENALTDSWLDDLIFGLSRGIGSERFSAEKWKSLLTETGFESIATITDSEDGVSQQVVVVARAGEPAESDLPLSSAELPERGTWLLLEDDRGRARHVGEELKVRGQDCIYVRTADTFARKSSNEFEANPALPEDMAALFKELPPLKGILHLWSLNAVHNPDRLTDIDLAQAEHLTCHATLHLVKQLEQIPGGQVPRLWLITSGGSTGREERAIFESSPGSANRIGPQHHQRITRTPLPTCRPWFRRQQQ